MTTRFPRKTAVVTHNAIVYKKHYRDFAGKLTYEQRQALAELKSRLES